MEKPVNIMNSFSLFHLNGECLEAWIHSLPAWRQTSLPIFRTNVILCPDKFIQLVPLVVDWFLPCIHSQCWIMDFCLFAILKPSFSCLLVTGLYFIFMVILPINFSPPSTLFILGINSGNCGMSCYLMLSNSVFMIYK